MKLNYKFKTEPFEHQLKALGCSWNKERKGRTKFVV